MNKERFAQAVLAQKEKFYRIAYAYVRMSRMRWTL